jgi:hypothetical protein
MASLLSNGIPESRTRSLGRLAFVGLIGLIALSWGTGCDSDADLDGDEPVVCTDESVTSVLLTLKDPMGDPVADATVTFSIDGAPAGACDAGSQGTYFCGEEQLGNFGIAVEAAGFVAVDAEILVADEDECHVHTEELTFHLVAL